MNSGAAIDSRFIVAWAAVSSLRSSPAPTAHAGVDPTSLASVGTEAFLADSPWGEPGGGWTGLERTERVVK